MLASCQVKEPREVSGSQFHERSAADSLLHSRVDATKSFEHPKIFPRNHRGFRVARGLDKLEHLVRHVQERDQTGAHGVELVERSHESLPWVSVEVDIIGECARVRGR